MSYQSIDVLQNILGRKMFSDRKAAKKAAGRALGTIVEIIAFYLLESWGFEESMSVECQMPEYGNPSICHNVEFGLHPVLRSSRDNAIALPRLPISVSKIRKNCELSNEWSEEKDNQLLSNDWILKNACTVAKFENVSFYNAYLQEYSDNKAIFSVSELFIQPYAMVECKRVGVEEGLSKGPQTIEKAKQGAYVARTVSSLQKIYGHDGEILGVLALPGNRLECKPYSHFLRETIDSNDPEILRLFTLTIGVVSNHGNWFTAKTLNKEMRVLAQSYDWLLFLTDGGLAEFVTELLLSEKYDSVCKAFFSHYNLKNPRKCFTKSRMDLPADRELRKYFWENMRKIESWFNIIAPDGSEISVLKKELSALRSKDWNKIYNDGRKSG